MENVRMTIEIVATHAVTGHQVALKLINRSKITTPDMNARVKREIQYLKVLRHPHIIKLYVLTALTIELFVLICKSKRTYIMPRDNAPYADVL